MRSVLLMLFVVLQLVIAQRVTAQQPVEVDVELALMVDVSRSMSPAEIEIQKRGYAEALTSDAVMEAIRSGMLGRIAITYVEWAGSFSRRTVVDWRLLETPEDAERIANAIMFAHSPSMRHTSISGAIESAHRSIDGNGFRGLRRVIDVSGDGPNNEGLPVTQARDAAVAAGMVINGLPLMTREGLIGQRWHLDDLDEYFRACVIGGPGSFVIPVLDWEEFAQAVRRKLVLEIAGRAEQRLFRAQFSSEPAYDCMLGERMRRRNDSIWFQP